MPYPSHASLCDVGPRDGFQFEQRPIPTELKVEIITALAEAGVPRIQAVSFVHPKWVPQMADAEAVMARLPEREGVLYTGLVLNPRGLERAIDAGLRCVDISIATNEQHSRDNANMTVEEGLHVAVEMVRTARRHGIEVQVGFQTVFGYAAPGDTPLDHVLAMARCFQGLGLESLSLADTTGLANPVMIKERVQAVRAVMGDVPLVLHLHDTRGLGLANVVAALKMGVDRFDTSLGGLGGCPFIPGAAGNIATEDTVYLLDQLGIRTGIDLNAVARASRRIADFLGRELSGKVYKLAV